MADNKIKVGYELNDNGSVEKLKKKTDAAAQSTDNLNKKKNYYNKQEKGAAGITSNSTKAFAKQAQTIGGGGGLVAAYATLAANIFAITAAFGVLQRAAAVQQLEQGLIFTGRAAGQNLPMVVDRLREITGGALAASDAMNSVALGISAGFSETQLEGLTQVARGASLALGRDMTDAMTRLVRGAAKLEPEILDELGIMVRLDDTTREYAASIGKTADELTQFERRMAFTNAIIDQGTVKFGALSKVVDPNPYDRLAASFDGLTRGIINFLNEGLKPVANFLADNIYGVLGVFAGLAAQTVNTLIPALTGAGQRMAELATASAETAKANIANVQSFSGAPRDYQKLSKAIKEGTASEKDMSKAKNSLTRSIRMHNIQMDSFIEKHGESSQAVVDKKAKLKAAETALNNITNAETQATVATQLHTRATLLNAAAQGSLREMLAAMRAMWAAEIASTAAATTGKGLLTTALAYLRTGFGLAAISAKAFGIALLQAIPVIGQIILVGSIAYELLKDFFTTPPNALDSELEKVQERLKEFPEVINQMANAYMVATNRIDKFVAAFDPLVGLTSQTSSQLQNLISVQMAENLGNQIAKTKELMEAEEKLAAAQAKVSADRNRKRSDMTGYGTLASSSSARAAQEEVDRLTARVEELKNAGIDTERTLQGAKEMMVGYSASLKTAQAFLEEGTSEYKDYQTAIEGAQQVLDLLNKGELDEAIKLHKTLTMQLKEEQQALKGVKDATSDIDAFFKKLGQGTGFFAERTKLLQTALNNLAKEVSPEIATLYESLGQFEGIDFPELKPGQILSEEQAEKVREQLKTLAAEMERLDKRAGDLRFAALAFEAANIANARLYGEDSGKTKVLALENEQIMLDQNLKLEQDRLKLLKAGTEEYDNQHLVVLRLLQDQAKLNQKKVATAMGATGSAAERMGTVAGTGALDIANQRESIAIVQNMVSPMIEDLQKLGPEGELVASVAQGAFVVASAWSNVGQVFADNASSMEKGAAVAAAVGATFQQIGSIMQAQSNAEIATIDKQIEAEKRRDGKSKESLARIEALEKRKEQQKRKAFEANKKVMMATTIANTAAAMMTALAPPPAGLGPVFGPALATIAGVMGAAQLAIIAGTSYDGGGSAPKSSMPSSVKVGNRQNTVDLAKAKSPSGELSYLRGDRGLGNATNFTPAFTGAKYRAAGGNTAFMVGEQGPELFVPERPGTIVPADETAGGMGAPVNVSFNINTVDNRGVEDLLTNQRGYIIGMIREAANAHGETFLEQVDERAYEMEK